MPYIFNTSKCPNLGPENCCEVPLDNNTPVQCEAVILTPIDDPVFPGRKCMEFRRAMTSTLNFDCTITPQIPVSAFLKTN